MINNWQANYFCKQEDLEKPGLQSDISLIPNWFPSPQIAQLEKCEIFSEDSIKPLKEYSVKCLEMQLKRHFQNITEDDED